MKKLLIASTSTVHGSGYLDYLLDELIHFFKSTKTIVFIPYARPGGLSHEEYTKIVQKAFRKIQKNVIGLHEFEDPKQAINQAEGIFVGGGNSYVLVDQLYKNDLLDTLKVALDSGTPYLGTSAGSNICGISMGTSNDMPIVHPQSFETLGVLPLNLYKTSFQKGFAHFYGRIEDYAVLALLPSYLERDGSSLVYMVEDMIQESKHPKSGFYLDDLNALKQNLLELEASGQKTLLIGVSYALLDLIEFHQFDLNHTIIMETGGMKGRRKELIKSELHAILKKGFGVNTIHSEYGMTELLSQAYSNGEGQFSTPSWMKVLIRDPEDALSILPKGKSGGINIIDLANVHSCTFIATQDLGKIHENGTFEVLGRFDQSDIRGCNLMVL